MDGDDDSLQLSDVPMDVPMDVPLEPKGTSLFDLDIDTACQEINSAVIERGRRRESMAHARAYRKSLYSLRWTLRPVLPLNPMKALIKEHKKEYHTHRFWFNHCEVVDFTVFEFGDRLFYLPWRMFFFLSTVIVTYPMIFNFKYNGTILPILDYSFSNFIWFHVWLAILLNIYCLLEIACLFWMQCRFPTKVLTRMHHTPWYVKLMWLLYNMLGANIMSCNFIYSFALEDKAGFRKVLLSSVHGLVVLHVALTAIPSRIAHVVQPLTLNLIHIAFTIIYPLYGGTNANGKPYVYVEMDWTNRRLQAVGLSVLWLFLTFSYHIVIVVCSWSRRVIFRWLRMNSTPQYGVSTQEYFAFNSDDEPEDEESRENETTDSSPTNGKRTYSPHREYRRRRRRDEAALVKDKLPRSNAPPWESWQYEWGMACGRDYVRLSGARARYTGSKKQKKNRTKRRPKSHENSAIAKCSSFIHNLKSSNGSTTPKKAISGRPAAQIRRRAQGRRLKPKRRKTQNSSGRKRKTVTTKSTSICLPDDKKPVPTTSGFDDAEGVTGSNEAGEVSTSTVTVAVEPREDEIVTSQSVDLPIVTSMAEEELTSLGMEIISNGSLHDESGGVAGSGSGS